MKQWLCITMPDGSEWGVPVEVIARHRAANYADEFGGDVERSLSEDTIPLFAESPYAVCDWASSNMDWCDVKEHACKLKDAPPVDFQEGWVNGAKRVRAAAGEECEA